MGVTLPAGDPATVKKTMNTGGNLPPQQAPAPTPPPAGLTGGGSPAPKLPPPAGTPVNPTAGTIAEDNHSPIALMDWQSGLNHTNTTATNRDVQGNELVNNQLNAITAQGSQYLTQAADRARNEASNRGMMMSTMAAGAGSRAAIDAALPIAQQDAAQYGHVADENMAATNADLLADQQLGGQLVGQAMGVRANLDEAERGRDFTYNQNQLQRNFQTNERLSTQQFTQQNQQMQNMWQAAQNDASLAENLKVNELQMAHDQAMRLLDENFQGSQLDKTNAEKRFEDFTNAMGNQTSMLSQTIASIYSNPNLKAAQQAAAVQNARAVYQSLFTSYAQSLSGGVPEIFWSPYQMQQAPASGGGGVPSVNPNTGGGGGGGGTTGGGGNLSGHPLLNIANNHLGNPGV